MDFAKYLFYFFFSRNKKCYSKTASGIAVKKIEIETGQLENNSSNATRGCTHVPSTLRVLDSFCSLITFYLRIDACFGYTFIAVQEIKVKRNVEARHDRAGERP